MQLPNSELREKSRRFETDGGTGGVGASRHRRHHQRGKDESPGDDGATGAAGIKQSTWRDGKADGHGVRLHEQQLPIRSRSSGDLATIGVVNLSLGDRDFDL